MSVKEKNGKRDTKLPKKTWNDFFQKEGISENEDEIVQVDKDNIAAIEENTESKPAKILEPKYDYDAAYSFREKNKLDGGDF